MKKRTLWIRNLIYSGAILLIIFTGLHLLNVLQEDTKRTMELHMNLKILINIIMFSGVGFVLGLDHFCTEAKKKGKWIPDIPRLIILGLPAFYFSFSILFYFCRPMMAIERIFPILIMPIKELLFYDSSMINVFQVIFGYVLATGFYKNQENISTKQSKDVV